MQTYEVLNTFKYDYPVLNMSISSNNNNILTSLINNDENHGLIYVKSIKTDKINTCQVNVEQDSINCLPRSKRYFRNDDVIENIESVKKPKYVKYEPYEKFLRKFEYQKAFHFIFNPRSSITSAKVVEVIKELMRRSALLFAMKGSNAFDIIQMIEFICFNIRIPEFTSLLLKLSNFFLNNRYQLNVFQEHIKKSSHQEQKYIKALNKLYILLAKEIEYLNSSYQVIGILDLMQHLSRIPPKISNQNQIQDINFNVKKQ
uniref:U3 small nucleolar RNA-associated protein 15 homolog (Trinotate prediction) n=1 Tax=Henneguya salminicola TaxID=69463 RepID=A0A6G3MFG6_HENSL